MIALAQVGSTKTTRDEEAEDKREEVVRLNPFIINEKSLVSWNSQMTFSGSRTATSLLETPASITVLTADYLKDIGASNIVQALQFSGSSTTNRVAYRDDITIRGFRQGLQRDGSGVSTNGFTPYYDVERVEIIKGPQALISSSFGNISGVINYVTKRPTSYSTGDMSMAVGSFGTYTADVTQRGPLTHDGRVRYRGTAGFQQRSGWMGKDQPGANVYNNDRLISASVDWTATDKLEISVDASVIRVYRRDFGRGLIDPVTKQLWVGSKNGFSTSAEWAKKLWFSDWLKAEGIYKISHELTVRARVFAQSDDSPALVPRPDGTTIGPASLRAAEYPNYQTIGMRASLPPYHLTTSTVEGDVAWEHNFGQLDNRLTFGYNYTGTDNVSEVYSIPLQPFVITAPISTRLAPPILSDPGWVKTTNVRIRRGGWTAYINESAAFLNKRLIVTGGIRYISSHAIAIPGKDEWVPAGGIVYRILPTISLYMSYAQSYLPQIGFDVVGTRLKDIIGRNTEGGIKFNALEGRLFGSIVYFDVFNDPVFRQSSFTDPVTGFIRVGNLQVGKETNKGWEMDLGWLQEVPSGEISTMATAYIADPKSATGLAASSAVSEKYTLFTKYHSLSGSLKGCFIAGGVSRVGEAPGTGFPWHPAYTLIQATVGYQVKKWAVRLEVDNVGDKRGIILGSESVANVGVAEPRSYRVSYDRKW